MMNEPSLPGQCEEVEAKRVLVLAPHFDDEILGCGGLLLALRERGAEVHLLFLSDGAAMVEEAEQAAYRQRRRLEAQRVAGELGATMAELSLPDGALAQFPEEIAAKVFAALSDQKSDLVLLPSPLEVSRDHRATFAAVHSWMATLRGEDFAAVAETRFFTYEVNFPQLPDLLVDVSRHLDRLESLMALYASQQERHDYWAARRGLLCFRTLSLPPEVKAAESYRRLTAEDFRLRGMAALIEDLGGQAKLVAVEEGPLVSVVVRTKDRPQFLAEALASVVRSTWRRLEVVLVNDGGAAPELPPDFPFLVRRVDLHPGRGRAGAANAGIAEASGEYLTFLDDDDVVEPEHFATLVALVRSKGVRVAYSDAAVGIYQLDGTCGWKEVERRLPYSRDFDPDLLLFDNYIPFHTLIFERHLLDDVGPLDEQLPFFEDWDFLIRLASKTPFHHLAQVTCEYRHFRGAGHHILGNRPREATDFLAMRAKVIGKHVASREPERIARVVDQLRAETVAAEEQGRNAGDKVASLSGQLQALSNHNLILQDADTRFRLQIEQLQREHFRLDNELAKTYEEIGRLDQLRRTLESTRLFRWQRMLGKFWR